VTTILPSKMSSTFESFVYFEAVLPTGSQSQWFHSQVDRFRKKPYSLEIYSSDCSKISHHMNLGLFDGDSWIFPDSFRLEASIGAASGYVDILPIVGTVKQSTPTANISDDLLVAAVLEDDYYATATGLAKYYSELGLKSDSGRTLRRTCSSCSSRYFSKSSCCIRSTSNPSRTRGSKQCRMACVNTSFVKPCR